jgi:hypothetical protein
LEDGKMALNKTLMTLAINKVVEATTCETLKNKDIFKSFLKDALGKNRKEVEIISNIIDKTEVCNFLYESATKESGVERTKILISRELTDVLLFDEKWVPIFLDVFSNAFTWKTDSVRIEIEENKPEILPAPAKSERKAPSKGEIVNFGGLDWLV